MIDKNMFKAEDFIIQVRPMLSKDNKWSGQVLINIATSGKNPLTKKCTQFGHH